MNIMILRYPFALNRIRDITGGCCQFFIVDIRKKAGRDFYGKLL
jgi:hypothetical protein